MVSFAYGQDAQIQGQISDPSGAAISKALVRVVDQRTGIERNTQTNDNGEYTVPGLTPGLYKIFVEASGFSTAGSDPITLNAAQNAVLNFTLRVGANTTDVVVTAEKREENLQDVPVPVSVINTGQLTDNNQVLLRDYYSSVPSFVVQPGILSTSILAIRGLGSGPGGGPGPTIGVTVDDVPYGGTETSTGGLWLPDLDPGDLARVEVLRGPQGTLYGADSMGGLLKFVTKDPSTDGFSGRIETGTNGVHNGAEPGYNIHGSVNLPLNSTLALRASAFKRQDPGYIDNVLTNQKGVNEAQFYGGRLSALWQASDSVSLKLSGLYQNGRADGASDVDVPLYGGPTGLGDLQQSRIPNTGGYDKTNQAYSAILKAKLGSIDLASITGYNLNRVYSSLDFTYAFGPLVEPVFGTKGAPFNDWTSTARVTQEVRLGSTIGRHFEWLVGGFYSHERYPDTINVEAEDPANGQIVGLYWLNQSVEPSTFIEYAAFADLTYHFTERFDIQVGGRESHVNFFSAPYINYGPYAILTYGTSPYTTPAGISKASPFTYLIAPRFKVSPDLMVYARFASGFRPGASNGGTPGVPSQSNPDKTESYEGGVKGDFLAHRLVVDASLYYIDWRNIQISLVTPVTSLEYFANGGGAKSEGVELSIETRPLRGLTIAPWVTFDDAVLTQDFPAGASAAGGYGVTGDRLPVAPRFSWHVSGNKDFPLSDDATGFIGGEVNYVGDRVAGFTSTPERLNMPAYTKTDVRAGVRIRAWTFNIYANNATDARGLLSGGPGADPPYGFNYITPRAVGFNLARNF
jgi:outer membrane receptor protein involved in Fe transport